MSSDALLDTFTFHTSPLSQPLPRQPRSGCRQDTSMKEAKERSSRCPKMNSALGLAKK